MKRILLLFLIFASCKHEPPLPCENNRYLKTWDGGIDKIVKRNCATCHNTSSEGNFNYYTQVKLRIDDGSFYQRVIVDRDMPPFKMDTCDYLAIKAWLDSGSPKNFK